MWLGLSGGLTDIGLVLYDCSYCVVIQGGTHELLGDLTSGKLMKSVGHVYCGTFSDVEQVAKEAFELRINNQSIDG